MSSAVAGNTRTGYFIVNQGNTRYGSRASVPSFGEPGPVVTTSLLHSAWYPLVVGTISYQGGWGEGFCFAMPFVE